MHACIIHALLLCTHEAIVTANISKYCPQLLSLLFSLFPWTFGNRLFCLPTVPYDAAGARPELERTPMCFAHLILISS